MEKIPSFTVDHLKLQTGVYVSRKDIAENKTITTFDLRFTKPNKEKVMNTAGIHAIEHLGATFLRNNTKWKDRIIYFGPMGCRTGFYLIITGDLLSKDIINLLQEMAQFILNFEGEIPGASAKDCGNYKDLNLSEAKEYTQKYYNEVLQNPLKERMMYPE